MLVRRVGYKLSLYVSEAVADDLAVVSELYPGDAAPRLIRRALASLAAEALGDLVEREAGRIEQEAYGLAWN